MSIAPKSLPGPVTPRQLYWPVLGFAALAGMRSAGAPTLLSHYLVRHPAPALATSPLRLLQQPAIALALKLAAAKEFKHDKNSAAAPRTAPRGLSLRAIGGALVGAAWFKANRQSALRGALLGRRGHLRLVPAPQSHHRKIGPAAQYRGARGGRATVERRRRAAALPAPASSAGHGRLSNLLPLAQAMLNSR